MSRESLERAIDLISSRVSPILGRPFLIAIDGPSCSGKTTLSSLLEKEKGYSVVHADDFFLPFEKRTKERLSVPGENIDHERLLEECIIPIKENRFASYKPFSCKTNRLEESKAIRKNDVYIIEGSYCMNRSLSDFYDLKVFLSISKDEQRKRLLERENVKVDMFLSKWIPLEDMYHKEYRITESVDLVIDMD